MKKLLDFIYKFSWLHTLCMKNKTYFRLRHIYWDYGGVVQMYDAWMREKRWVKDNYEYIGKNKIDPKSEK